MLTKEQILAAKDLDYEEVAVPEWGGTVRIRSLNGRDGSELEQLMVQQKSVVDLKMKLVRATLCNGNGEPMFSDAELTDLWSKSHRVLNRLADEAFRINGWTKQDQEDIQGNLPATPGAASGSS